MSSDRPLNPGRNKAAWQKFNGWEVDWSKRKRLHGNPVVWARNPKSAQKRARAWHWATWESLRKAGINWKPVRPPQDRTTTVYGYILINRRAMNSEQLAAADEYDLWIGRTGRHRQWVKEHQLVAAIKYGGLPDKFLVRHVNGNKADNRPENLLLGTHKDNTRDHKTAVLLMMYWRERALRAEGKGDFLPEQFNSGEAFETIRQAMEQ